jgi:hypothetical protein
MFILNFGTIYLFQFFVLFEGVRSKKRSKMMCMIKERYIMHEMFKLSFKNISTSIPIPNHISIGEDHV